MQQKNLQFKRELSLKPTAANAELISSQNTKGRKSAIKIVFQKKWQLGGLRCFLTKQIFQLTLKY